MGGKTRTYIHRLQFIIQVIIDYKKKGGDVPKGNSSALYASFLVKAIYSKKIYGNRTANTFSAIFLLSLLLSKCHLLRNRTAAAILTEACEYITWSSVNKLTRVICTCSVSPYSLVNVDTWHEKVKLTNKANFFLNKISISGITKKIFLICLLFKLNF